MKRFWVGPNRRITEHGVASEILREAGVKMVDLVSRPENQDPPDCEGKLDGRWSGVEVTELVHQKALKRSIKHSEAYFLWNRKDLIAEIQDRIDANDAAKIKGGPYERYVLVIHSDELILSRPAVTEFLQGARFRTKLITDVFLGLSYEPGFGIPTFRLDLDLTGR
jgi:hypothetical protein